MGKKLFATVLVAVVAIAAGYNIYQSQNTVSLSELALDNVEALANGEANPNCPNGCIAQEFEWCFCYTFIENAREARWN